MRIVTKIVQAATAIIVLLLSGVAFTWQPDVLAETTTHSRTIALLKPLEINPRRMSAPEQVIEITSEKLIETYNADPIGAARQFKGKLVRLTGTVSFIGTDVDSKPCIIFAAGGSRQTKCVFADERDIPPLLFGTRSTVVGRCDGDVWTIALRHCRIVNPQEYPWRVNRKTEATDR